MKLKKFLLFFLCISFLTTLVPQAFAHGFGVRIDLPIPVSLYMIGGGATVLISFILITLITKKTITIDDYPHYNLTKNKLFKFFATSFPSYFIKLIFILLFILIIITGLIGNQEPTENLTPTVIWIYLAVALTFISAFIGNIWIFINPLRSLFTLYEAIYKKIKKHQFTPSKTYPSWLSMWSSVFLFYAYRWIENAYQSSSVPFALAIFILIYTLITFIGMARYGKDTWLNNADPFTVLYNLLSKFALIHVDQQTNEVYLRPPMVGLDKKEHIPLSQVVFIILMMATITYDGLKATEQWVDILTRIFELGIPAILTHTLGYTLIFALFLGAYFLSMYLIKQFGKTPHANISTKQIASSFALSFLPIAVAYEIAHYLILLITQGQRIVSLASDPFGWGWNLFGTATKQINFSFINFHAMWNLQVSAVIIGHIVAVYLAHAAALRLFRSTKAATRSQYPMMLLMILYTMSSLWILAQPLTVGAH